MHGGHQDRDLLGAFQPRAFCLLHQPSLVRLTAAQCRALELDRLLLDVEVEQLERRVERDLTELSSSAGSKGFARARLGR